MYYTDDSILPEYMQPLIITAAPYGPAFDGSYTHMYAPGTRRHIHNALQAGATMKEIMEVLKLCVVQGVQARCNLGVPILAEEPQTRPQFK